MVQLCHALFGSWVHCAANVQPLVYGIRVNGVFEGDGCTTYTRVPLANPPIKLQQSKCGVPSDVHVAAGQDHCRAGYR